MIQTFITVLAWIVFPVLSLLYAALFLTQENVKLHPIPALMYIASIAWIITTFIN